MLGRLGTLLSNLETFPDRMKENLDKLYGVVYSQRVLLALLDKGLGRDEAYEIVQKNALAALDSRRPFKDLLKADPRATKVLPEADLNMLFEPRFYFQHLDHLYKKVLENDV